MMVYKYLTADNFFQDGRFENYLKGKLHFADWKREFEDKKEGKFIYIDPKRNEYALDVLKKAKYELRVCSTTLSNNNFCLWKHYAEKGNGIAVCLVLKVNTAPPAFVQFNKKAYTISKSLLGDESVHSNIDYVQSLECYKINGKTDPELLNIAIAILMTKLVTFDYEDEHRFIKDTDKPMDEFGELTEIIFNKKPTSSSPEIIKIHEYANEHNGLMVPKIKYADINYNTKSVSISDMEIQNSKKGIGF